MYQFRWDRRPPGSRRAFGSDDVCSAEKQAGGCVRKRRKHRRVTSFLFKDRGILLDLGGKVTRRGRQSSKTWGGGEPLKTVTTDSLSIRKGR